MGWSCGHVKCAHAAHTRKHVVTQHSYRKWHGLVRQAGRSYTDSYWQIIIKGSPFLVSPAFTKFSFTASQIPFLPIRISLMTGLPAIVLINSLAASSPILFNPMLSSSTPLFFATIPAIALPPAGPMLLLLKLLIHRAIAEPRRAGQGGAGRGRDTETLVRVKAEREKRTVYKI